MCGANDAHIDDAGFVFPQSLDLTSLQDAQQFGLYAQVEFGDFVQKQCAFVRFNENALALGYCSGEGPLGVAKKFTFDQFLGDRRAVDGDQIPVFAWAARVDGIGRQLLAGAGLTRNTHRRIALRHGFNHLVNRLHFGALAQELLKLARRLYLQAGHTL